jgi:hypothetical protein
MANLANSEAVGAGMPDKVLGDLRAASRPVGPAEDTLERSAAAHGTFWLAAYRVARTLGGAEACHRDHLFDLDRRQPAAPDGLCRAAQEREGRRPCAINVV